MASFSRAIRVAVLLAIAAAMGALSVHAQSSGALSQAKQPKIELVDPVYDFGTALEGRFVSHPFKIRNAGKGDLVITGVHTSCGCTAAAPSKKHLGPGETADVQVTFDTRSQKGHRVRTTTIFSNDPQTPSAVVTLQGDIKVEVEATPSEVNFDKVHRGTEQVREVTISDLTKGKDFRVGPISNSSPNIRVTRLARKDGQSGTLLQVALLKTMPIGPFDDTIDVVTNRRPIQVHVFGQVTGDLALEPAQVSFGIVPHGQSVLRILKLTNQGPRPVQVMGVTSTSQSVATKVEPISPGKEYKITVELRRNTPDGQLRGQLAIRTDNPEQATLIVPFYGIIGSFEG